MGKTNPFHAALRRDAKQMRSDARKLDVIAKHLRSRAMELLNGIKVEEKAAAARANFFSKESKVDPGIPLVPNIGEDSGALFPES